MSSRSASVNVTSRFFIAALAVVSLHCGGDGGGGVTPPTEPAIGLGTSTAPFSATAGGAAPASQEININNTGGGTLDGLSTSISYTAGQPTGWLNAALSGTQAPSILSLTVTPASLAPATYTARVAVTSVAASNSPQTVTVTFSVAPGVGPLIAFSTSIISFAGTQGSPNPTDKTVAITNGGTGSLTGLATATSYGAGQPTDWLTAMLDQTTAPSTLTVAANIGALAPGTYTATVNVTSGVAGNSPQTVAVTFVVSAPPPVIVLSAATVDFHGVESTDPPPQTVDITNGVTGPLSGLAADVSYQAGQPTGWLLTALSAADAPSTLTLTPMIAGLGEGTYTATVNVSAPGATNSPQAITVTFTVASSETPLLSTPSSRAW